MVQMKSWPCPFLLLNPKLLFCPKFQPTLSRRLRRAESVVGDSSVIFIGYLLSVYLSLVSMTSSAWGVKEVFPVDGEFLIMRPLVSETIPDNVTATQNALGLPVAVGLFQRLPLGFVDAGSDGSESHCNTL